MPWINFEDQKLVADILDDAILVRSICPCKERISAIIRTSDILSEKFDGYYVFADILDSMGYPMDNVLRSSVVPPQCGHVGVSGIHMVVNKEDISRVVCKERMLIFNASVSFANQSPILDARGLGCGMIDLCKSYSGDAINCAEFFSGGFSGWTHAVTSLNTQQIKMKHIWGLDKDYLAVQTYVRSHRNSVHINSGKKALEHLQYESLTGEKACMVFQADIRDAWYLNYIPNEEIHLLCLSPPCQPWSSAHTSLGFNRADGKVFVSAMTKVACVRPKILVLEEVAQFGKHDQFPIVTKLFDWAEFQIVDHRILNLNRLLPQNRARFLLVAIDKHASGVTRFVDWADWPIPASVTIRKARVILPIDSINTQEVIPTPEVLKMYMDQSLLPVNEYSPFEYAGTKMHVRKIRIKVIDDPAFGCIMANYRKAHHLPKQVLHGGGLYGTFLYHDNVVRFLTTGEIFLLMGPTKSCNLPACFDAQSHLLGNCISVPHATIAILNGLRCLSHLVLPAQPEDLFAHVFGKRLTNDNLIISHDDSGINLLDSGDINFFDEPTLDFPSISPLTITTPTTKYELLLENGVNIKEAIEMIAGPSTPKSFVICTSEGLCLPMLDTDVMGRNPMDVHTNLPSVMSLQESQFVTANSECCLILTPSGPVVIHRQCDMTVRCLYHFLKDFFPEMVSDTTVFTNQFGIEHGADKICPDLVMIRNCIDGESQESHEITFPAFTEILDHLTVRCDWSHAFKILKFYQCRGLSEVLKCLGWSIQIIPEAGGCRHHVLVTIAKLPYRLAMKCSQIQMCLNTRLLIQSLPDGLDDDGENIQVHLKLWDAVVFQGFCKPDATIATLIDKWEMFSNLHGNQTCLRTVHRGQNIMPHVKFGELLNNESQIIKLHAVLQLHGGGNKQDALQDVKHALAIFMMGQGADLKDVSYVLEVLGRNAGLHALKKISEIHVVKDKISALQQLATSLNVRWPDNLKGDESKVDRVKSWSKKRSLTSQHVCASQFTLLPEVFVNEDGSHPNIRSSVATGASGVVLLDFDQAKPWLVDQKIITSDELAIAVLGHECPCDQPTKCQHVNLPVNSVEGETVIVKACFHNLGEKKIVIKPTANDKVSVNAGTVAAITIYRDEIAPGDWKHVTNGPVRYALASFELNDEAVFQGPPWGRSWLASGEKSSPENASSLQFHVRVDSTKLESLMKASGSNGTYITPKADNNMADNRYTIVWLEGNPIDIAQCMLKTPEHLGQVRINKGKGENAKINRGVRCKREQFAAMFAKLRPNDDPPDVTPIECLYKIQPTPVGAQMKDVQAWMKLQGWDGRPLKLLGDKCWLIGSAKPFDRPFLSWNSSSILVKKVQSKHATKTSPVVAGKIPPSSSNDVGNANRAAVDPLTIADPWKQYNASSSAGSRMTFRNVGNLTAQREVDPPTETRFKKQGEQISALETAMTEIRSKIESNEQQQDKFQHEVRDEFKLVRTEVTNQIENVSKSFEHSLDRALRKQESSMDNSFAELKQLIRMSNQPLANKKAKATKAPHDPNDMEDVQD